MRRRAFIAGLGSAAAWPVVARGQQTAAMPVIGYMSAGSAEGLPWRAVKFQQGLNESGFEEGQNVLALLWQISFMQQSCVETFSAVRASLKRSHDAVDDGVTHGRQAWLRWRPVDSFFPASLE